MKSVIGYVRVSTAGQVDDGVSLEAQEAKIRAYAMMNDLEVAGIFIDAGISGKRTDNRPQLAAALEAVCKSRGVLVAYSLSRLSRSTADAIAIAERLERADADLVSLSERIDTTSAAGRMFFRLMASLAEFERDLISERTTAALAHKKRQGERTGKVPFGFDLAADGVALIPNVAEQSAIAMIGELRASGLSLRDIAAELNRRAVPTKGGGAWKHTSVARIVNRAAV